MGCWSSDGHYREKSNLLTMSMWIYYIMEKLMEFCDEKKVNREKFEPAVRSAAELLKILGADYFPKSSRTFKASSFYWKDWEGRQHTIHYEQLDVFSRVVEKFPTKPWRSIMEVRKNLFSLIGQRWDQKSKKKNAEKCIKFFCNLNAQYLWEYTWYVPRMPKGLKELLKSDRRVTKKPKTRVIQNEPAAGSR